MKKLFRYLSFILIIAICCSLVPIDVLATANESNVVQVENDESSLTNELSQKKENMNAMLNTKLGDFNYWEIFSQSDKWPAYTYLDYYYNDGKDWSITSLFRKYVAPSIIMIGDKLHNGGGGTDQSKERARQLIIKLIEDNSNNWAENSFYDECIDNIDDILDLYEDTIKSNKSIYEKYYDNQYTKLQDEIDSIRQQMIIDASKGRLPNSKRVSELSKISEINKSKIGLVKNLEKNQMKTLKLEANKYLKAWNIAFTTKQLADLTTEKYQILNTLLRVDSNFISMLNILKTSKTSEVKNAAEKLLNQYKSNMQDNMYSLVDSIVESSYSTSTDLLKDMIISINPLASFINDIGGYILKTGEKIDAFEKLRLSIAISYTFDGVLNDAMKNYKKTKSSESIYTIYQYAPYILALREQNEEFLCSYLLLLNSNNEDSNTKHMKDIKDAITKLKTVLYKNLTITNTTTAKITKFDNGTYPVIVTGGSVIGGSYYLQFKTFIEYECPFDYLEKVDYDMELYYKMNYPVVKIKDGKKSKILIQDVCKEASITKEELFDGMCIGGSDDNTLLTIINETISTVKFSNKCKITLCSAMSIGNKLNTSEDYNIHDISINSEKVLIDTINNIFKNSEFYKESGICNIYITIKNNEITEFNEVYSD